MVESKVAYVSYGPCAICKRDTDSTSVNVDIAGTIVTVCDTCWSRRDEDIELPLDMTEDEPNLEGMPEFNGAFR
jgi:ribosome-binding protein aMBF1 (putative translation factor)